MVQVLWSCMVKLGKNSQETQEMLTVVYGNNALKKKHLKSLTEDLQDYFQHWTRMWDKCTATNGEYFEGDKIDVP